MNKLLLFIVGLFLTTTSTFSQHSIFSIFSDEGEKFFLYVDGEKINDFAKSRVANIKQTSEITNLKVEFEDMGIPAVKKNLQQKDFDGNYQKTTLILKRDRKGKFKIRINSFEVYKPEESANETIHYEPVSETNPSTEVVSSSNSNTNEGVTISMNVNESNNDNPEISVNTTDPESNENITVSMNIDTSDSDNSTLSINTANTESSENISFSMNISESTVNTETTSTNIETTTKESTPKTEGCTKTVSAYELGRIKSTIKSKTFEDTKLTIAKDIVKSKCLSSTQIRDITKMFDFEDTRLEFAIYGYKFVLDKENYYEVYNAFEYELTIEDLKEAIK